MVSVVALTVIDIYMCAYCTYFYNDKGKLNNVNCKTKSLTGRLRVKRFHPQNLKPVFLVRLCKFAHVYFRSFRKPFTAGLYLIVFADYRGRRVWELWGILKPPIPGEI